jgi:hypothetical protein
MQLNAGKLQILTVAAMLVLISGGIAAYAQAQYAPSSGAPAGAAPGASAAQDNNSTSSMFTSTDTETTFSTSTSTTSTISSTTTANHTLCQPTTPVKVGRLVLPITAVAANSSSGSISFSFSRGCFASITAVGGIFNVDIALRYAKPVTQYMVVLVANGTSYTLGNMVTGPGGAGQIQNQVLLKTGTYVVSIQIYDTSSNPGQSTLVLQTAQGTIVSPPFPAANSSQQPVQGGQGDQGNQGGQGKSGHHK